MSLSKPVLLIIVTQIIPILIMPPALLFSLNGLIAVGVLVLLFAGLGFALVRRNAWARNLSLFLQGFNIIVRVMMLFPNARSRDGVWDVAIIVTFVISIALSVWFLQRLDRPDFQSLVTS